ncbi:hypothetical protein CL618_03695 [archaeon]|nr:hypothetical protein [archaeon]
MSIEFIRDEFLEGKKEELDHINKELSKRVKKKPKRDVIFLRRFTLALLGQYDIRKKHLHRKQDEIDILNRRITHETKHIHQFRRPIQRLMPSPPMNIPTPSGLNIPMPMKKTLQIPNPLEKKKVNKETNIPTPL